MKKRGRKQTILSLCFGMAAGLLWLGGSSLTAEAAQQKTAEITVESNRTGCYGSVYIGSADEIPVLTSGEAWADTLKSRLTYAISTYQSDVYIEDLQIVNSNENIHGIVEAYQQVIDENPSLFYANSGFSYNYWDNTGVITKINLWYDNYTDDRGHIDMTKINAYKAAISQAMTVVKPEMSDVEKALALHDYLALNCEYDWGNYVNDTLPEASYSSYGALVNGKAVCMGYAYAYAEMLRTAGIQTYVLASDDMDHAWNLVYLDGAWYHIDVTADDPLFGIGTDCEDSLGSVYHDYFVKSDVEMTEVGYYGWAQEFTGNIPPSATVSESYADYIFRIGSEGQWQPGQRSSYTYDNGYWYYITEAENASWDEGRAYVTRSKISGEDRSVFSGLGLVNYVQMIDGRLYFADCNGVYTTLLSDNMQRQKIWTAVGSKTFINCTLSELAVCGNNTISMELYDEQLEYEVRIVIDINAREFTAPTLVILTMPNLNYFGAVLSPVHKDGGVYGVRYSDGTVFPVSDLFAMESAHADMDQDGVYSVNVKWRDLALQYEISMCNDFPITDVLASSTNWKYEGIRYVYDNNYMNGVGENKFEPDMTLTRGMLVQILYNMEGAETEFEELFPDVEEDDWFAEAVTWAYKNEIASGYDTGEFGAEDSVTREQAAVMLYGYAALKGIDTDQSADLSGFTDVGLVDWWAEDAIAWANYNEIINGKPGPVLDPVGEATRAEMAAMITTFAKAYIE